MRVIGNWQELFLIGITALVLSGCARSVEPTVLQGASETRAVILSDPDRDWRQAAEVHCNKYGRAASLRSVKQPDDPPHTVKGYLGASEMGPNKLYYVDCVET